MPTKSYIWGYITGITVILLGVAPILASFIYWVDGEWIFSFTKPLVISIQRIDVELTYPGLSTEVLRTIFGVIILVGVLIVFKRSLGWYVQYPFLFYWVGFSSFWQECWLTTKSTIESILIPSFALRPFSR
jgi:hypothetical protein